MSEAIENTSIGWSHGGLTGPIFLRAVDQLHLLEFRSARSKDWPVNQTDLIIDDVRPEMTRAVTETCRVGDRYLKTPDFTPASYMITFEGGRQVFTVRGKTAALFLAADKKCASRYLEALGMEGGLEGRKLMADLMRYCGSLIPDSSAAVDIGRTDGPFSFVELLDWGKSGWVPSSWIIKPAHGVTKK